MKLQWNFYQNYERNQEKKGIKCIKVPTLIVITETI